MTECPALYSKDDSPPACSSASCTRTLHSRRECLSVYTTVFIKLKSVIPTSPTFVIRVLPIFHTVVGCRPRAQGTVASPSYLPHWEQSGHCRLKQSGHGRLDVIDFLGMDVLLIFLRVCGCFSTSIMFHIPEKEKRDDKKCSVQYESGVCGGGIEF